MSIYIKELNNDTELKFQKEIPNFLKKTITKIIKIFNIVVVENIKDDDYLYIIPKISNLKKIRKIIKKSKARKVILSKKIKKYSKELGIEENNNLPKYFIYSILKYIQKITNIEIEIQSIYILTNVYNSENVEIIKYLVKNIKSVNVITNRIKEYSRLEEKLYDDGNLIAVTNNKKKSLKNANFIINLDLNNDELLKYNINRKSIIINCASEKISKLRYFEGIIINNVQIKPEYDNMFNDDFDYIDILENYELKYKKYNECIDIIKNINIVNLLGSNGIINIKEILNIIKI